MGQIQLLTNRKILVFAVIVLASIFTLWIRLLPFFALGDQDILNYVAMDDPFYNFRQIELMVHNFPQYAWYDPMTLYPDGFAVFWGPMIIFIASALALLAGASTPAEIVTIGLLVPPIMAAAMVPVVYYIGKTISGWKTGLVAAVLIAAVSGQYFYRSLFGYLDHHIAEVLFSAIFALGYIAALSYSTRHPIRFSDKESLKIPAAFSLVVGVLYLLGLFTMPTMILFALIVGIFTVFQFIWNFWKQRASDYLVILNSGSFGVAAIGLVLFGFNAEGISLARYTVGHVFAYLGLIMMSVLLYLLSRYLAGKQTLYYIASLAGIALVGTLVVALINPGMMGETFNQLYGFFGQSYQSSTIQEAQPWSLEGAWDTFNYGLILMFAGIGAILYRNWREEHPASIFLLVWSVVILIATIQHVRYEYYLAVVVVLLSAVSIGLILDAGWRDTLKLVRRGMASSSRDGVKEAETASAHAAKKRKKEPKAKESTSNSPSAAKVGMFFGVAALALLFVSSSLVTNYSVASSGGIRLNPEWKETLEWMHNSTPDTGVDFYKIYDKATFQYPPESYGVMSWWDYGHIITYIAKRIPNANPFQAGVAGPTGASTFFITQSEETAAGILDERGTRYVITDIDMDIQKFWAMATWYNSTLGDSPYRRSFLATNPDDPTTYQVVNFYTPAYYNTMISRLHNFDGSMVNGSRAYYIEYQTREDIALPVLTSAREMPQAAAQAAANTYNQKAPAGYRATVLNTYPYTIYDPLGQVPALRHFRLVHESPTNIFRGTSPDIKYVKTFEYVPGAHIKGEGIIELDLVSNTGRNFTYRQQSQNGEFIVPYSTSGSPYDVKALGKYRLAGTGAQFDVSEEAVMQGTYIN